MNILLISPPTPDTFWSFKHVLAFRLEARGIPTAGTVDRGRDVARRLAAQAGRHERTPSEGPGSAVGRLCHAQRDDRAQGLGRKALWIGATVAANP